MTGPSRSPDGATINFTFDGRPLKARAGDTLAAALLANGIGLVGRSFKYHRPRGIMTAGIEEPNALVTVGEGGRADAWAGAWAKGARGQREGIYGAAVAR